MDNNNLYILWTNDNIETSINMVIMYAKASLLKKWWDKVKVIVWGDTLKLVAENKEIQQAINQAKHIGVEFSGCLACATNLNVVDKLKDFDLDLKYWGEDLTKLIKNKEHLITV